MKHSQPPTSAVYVDDLLNIYLPQIGRRMFEWVDASALKQYSLETLHAAIKHYGLQNMTEKELWERIERGNPHDHILLAPDNPDGTDLGTTEPIAIHLKGIPHPKALLRKIYRNTILREECDPERAQQKVKNKVLISNRPPQRRANPNGGHSSLESQSEATGERHKTISEELVRKILEKVTSKMRPDHVEVVMLLLSGKSTAEVAELTGMKGPNIYAINRSFRANCQKARSFLENTTR